MKKDFIAVRCWLISFKLIHDRVDVSVKEEFLVASGQNFLHYVDGGQSRPHYIIIHARLLTSNRNKMAVTLADEIDKIIDGVARAKSTLLVIYDVTHQDTVLQTIHKHGKTHLLNSSHPLAKIGLDDKALIDQVTRCASEPLNPESVHLQRVYEVGEMLLEELSPNLEEGITQQTSLKLGVSNMTDKPNLVSLEGKLRDAWARSPDPRNIIIFSHIRKDGVSYLYDKEYIETHCTTEGININRELARLSQRYGVVVTTKHGPEYELLPELRQVADAIIQKDFNSSTVDLRQLLDEIFRSDPQSERVSSTLRQKAVGFFSAPFLPGASVRELHNDSIYHSQTFLAEQRDGDQLNWRALLILIPYLGKTEKAKLVADHVNSCTLRARFDVDDPINVRFIITPFLSRETLDPIVDGEMTHVYCLDAVCVAYIARITSEDRMTSEKARNMLALVEGHFSGLLDLRQVWIDVMGAPLENVSSNRT